MSFNYVVCEGPQLGSIIRISEDSLSEVLISELRGLIKPCKPDKVALARRWR